MSTSTVSEEMLASGDALRQLAAYIPTTLADRILRQGLPTPGEPHALNAATLFSDISGFTGMSEELASDGPRGAEELNRVLLVTFTAMIDVIHELGGAVNHFYGDAMSVYFPDWDGSAAQRALVCAQMMQQLMLTSFNRVVTNRPPGKHPFFELTIKIGVGYGRCQELVVGNPQQSLEFVLTGTAVDEAAMAERQANSGDIIASAAVLRQAGLPADGAFQKLETAVSPPPTQPILNWSNYDEAAQRRLAELILPFVPPALHRRLVSTGATEIAEHRPVTTIFVQFDYKNRQDDSSAIETADLGRQLQAYYEWACEVVSRFGQENARVNRVLTGDKGNQLHIMFGAPVAPDTPEQALRCLLALQREKPNFIEAQRIGVSVGKVFAGPVGSSARREYTVVGDVVNQSARLMQVCDPGAILTDQVTAERTRQVIECEPLPAIHLKGKQTAVTPHLVQRDRVVTTLMQAYIDRWERPLVGREEELDLLLGGMDAALRGIGGAAAVYGGTGVGKSRLLATGVHHWLENEGLGLIGVCYPHTKDTPYSPWRDVWREYFGLVTGMPVMQQIAAVVMKTQALVPDVGDDVGLWRELLGLPMPQPASLGELTAEARQVRLFSLVRRCCLAIAAKQPLLIVLEGLQWADQATLALLDEVSSHLDGAALFLAFTFRMRNAVEIEAVKRPSCIPIPLVDLSPGSARQMLAQLVGTSELPQAVEQHLGMRDREGRDSPVNPLFLEEALNVMMGAGVLRVNGRVQVDEAELARMQVPDTIHGLLLARLDRLPPAGRDLLQVASVIGRQFSVEPLQVIADTPLQKTVLQLLTDLSEAEMTRLITADPEWIYLFQHAMTHEVAYESLPYARRQQLHAAVAGWLATKYEHNLKPLHPVLAYHYSRADNHSKALEFALLAADEARNIFANREAIDLYNLAERHLVALDDEDLWETAVHLYLFRGEAYLLIGDFSQAISDSNNAIQLTKTKSDYPNLARAYNLLAELKCRQSFFEDAQRLTEIVINQLGEMISEDELARSFQWSGMSATYAGKYSIAEERLSKAEELCRSTNNRPRLALILETKAFVHFSQKQLEKALDAMLRSIDLSKDFSKPANIASALSNAALIQYQLGNSTAALASIEDAISFARDTSHLFLAQAICNRAEFLCYQGRYTEALESFNESIDLFSSTEDISGLLDVYILLGFEYYLPLDNLERAKDYFDQASDLLNSNLGEFPELEVRLEIALATYYFQKNESERAKSILDNVRQEIAEKEMNWWKPFTYYLSGLVSQQKSKEAKEFFLQALQTSKEDGCPDYDSLIWLELAKNEEENIKIEEYLRQSLASLQKRARFADKVVCLRELIQYLAKNPDEESSKLRRFCVEEFNRLTKNIKEIAP